MESHKIKFLADLCFIAFINNQTIYDFQSRCLRVHSQPAIHPSPNSSAWYMSINIARSRNRYQRAERIYHPQNHISLHPQ